MKFDKERANWIFRGIIDLICDGQYKFSAAETEALLVFLLGTKIDDSLARLTDSRPQYIVSMLKEVFGQDLKPFIHPYDGLGVLRGVIVGRYLTCEKPALDIEGRADFYRVSVRTDDHIHSVVNYKRAQ